MAGEFQGADLEQVRNYFLKSEQRQEKLRFALALREQKEKRIAVNEPTRKRLTPYLAIAASVLAIIGIGFFAWRSLRPQPDLRAGLVALQAAFPEERPIEGRLSDFKYVPLPNQRGGSSKVDQGQRELAATLLLKLAHDNPTASTLHAAAKYHLMLHEFEQSNQEFAAALALDPQNAKIHSDFGAGLFEEGRMQPPGADGKQLQLYGRSLDELNKALELDSSLLEALFNRALLLQYMSPSEQAKIAWKDYLQRDSTSPWADEARRNLQIIENEQRGASRSGNDNLQAFLQASSHGDDSAAWKIVSETYTSAGNEIANHLIDSLFGIEPADSAVETSKTLPNLLYLANLEQTRSGDRFTADLANYYSNIIPKFKPVIANARRYMRTGYSSFEKSKFKEAINQYNQAKLQYERAHDTAGQAFVEYRIAHCYVLLTDLTRARLAFSRLLIDAEAKRYRWLAAQCLFGLGHASVDEDEFSKAVDYSEQALTRFEKIGDANGIIRSLIQLADFNQAMNLIGKSLGYLIRAWALADMTHSQLAQRWGILNQIGFSMSSLQFNAAALFYQKEALDLALKFGNRLLASRSYGYVGSAYAALKMYPEALNVATEAFDIGANASNEIEGREIMANASLRLGDVYREAGKCDQSIPNYERSLTLYRGLKTENYSYEAHKGKLKCFIAASNKKAVRKELGVVLRLSESYRSKINSENQRNSFFDAEQGVYDLAIAYESGIEGNYEKAFEYSEKSRARSLLDAVLSGAKLRKKQGEIDIKLPVVTSSLSSSEIKNRMPEGTLLIEYAVLEDRLVIWVVTPTKLEHKVVPITAGDLTAKVRIFLDALNHSKSSLESYRQTATELYDILIGPVADFLEDSKTIYVVADKILNYLPYAALVSPKNRYLIEDYDLGVASSGSLFVNQSAVAQRYSKTGDENLLVAGDPKFNRRTFASLRELPSSALECNEISRLYPNHQRLVRDDATEENIKAAMESADVVHFAMHFVINERSEMLSGFPLTPSASSNAEGSDGFLQSYEIYGLNLRRVRLAVLSACQTGIERQYQGEGAIGAARPFFVAGVPTVIASLWPVDSDAAAELMVNFHKHRRESVSATRALKRAQLDMIQGVKIEFRHPYYWAPFLAIGGVSN